MLRTNVVGTTPPPGSGAQRCAQAGERDNSIDSTAGAAATTAARLSMASVYDGQTCIGFIFSRDKHGIPLRLGTLQKRAWRGDGPPLAMAAGLNRTWS
jgi:hypothetical protein